MALWDDLKAYWPLNGNVYDYMVTTPGTEVSSPTYSASKPGFGTALDGSSGYATFGTPAYGTNSLTFSYWIKPASLAGTYQMIWDNRTASYVGISVYCTGDPAHSNRIGSQVSSVGVGGPYSNIWSTDPPVAGTWYHVVVVIDRGTNTQRMYVNGVLQSYASDTPSIVGFGSLTNSTAQLGHAVTAGVVDWAGLTDDVAWWDRALTADEILQIYTAGNAGKPLSELIPRRQFPDGGAATSWIDMAGNVGLWHLDDLSDFSGQGNHGTATGAVPAVGMTLYSGSTGFTGSYDFNGGTDAINVAAGSDLLPGTTNNISISLWQYGDEAAQPTADTIFECRNGGGTRILYIHLPWSDSNIYFDHGNSGGLDRINKVASVDEFEGRWNHWVFTKDVSLGEMKMYLNGVEWHNGTGKTRTLDAVGDFTIGDGDGSNAYNGRLDELSIWNRTINSDEVLSIYNAQKFLFLGTGSVDAINLFASVVHDAPATATGINLFASVVHDAQPPTATGINLFASVVHDAQPPTATGINLFASVVHDTVQISGTVANITGTVGNPATFDATTVGTPTGSAAYLWSWQSVPVGSSISSASFSLPDNKATTPVNMSGNVGLWHFETTASITPFPDSQAATPIDMTNNVALWHFENNANDSSGVGNNLTEFGSPVYVTGKVESKAIDFNGTTQYANDTISSPPTTDGSWSGWFKFNSFDGSHNMIAGFGDGTTPNGRYRALLYISGRLYFWGYGNDFDITGTSISAGSWFHVALTWQATTDVKVYLNGAEVYSATMGGLIAPSDQFWIAKRPDLNQFSDIEADEIAIWSRVLSGGEIRDIFDYQAGGTIDSSGEGNNGLLNGVTRVAGRIGSYAYEFNGSSDYIDVGSNFAYTTEDFSFSFWVYEGATQGSFVNIFGNQSSNKGICFESDGAGSHSYRFIAGDGSWTFGTSVTLDTLVWQHITITRNNSTVKVFKNGQLVVTDTTFPSSFSSAIISMYLGANQSDGRYWKGVLDEFAIWDRSLSGPEAAALFFLNSGSCASGSVGLGETFTFTPDVTGTYTIQLGLEDGVATPISGNVDALIDDAPAPPPPSGSIISGSNPGTTLISAGAASSGYVFNTNKIDLLSVQRARTSEQVPFILGTKSKQTLRLRTNQDFTGSA